MTSSIIESSYPINFREEDAQVLGYHLKSRHNISYIGMKRVGISSFLRFFLYHKDIPQTYIKDLNHHLFIPIDLNNLVERELFPFWILTLKRISDIAENSNLLKNEIKKQIQILFLDGIQYKDLFLLIESVRKALVKIVEAGVIPTLFFIRFDRIKDAVTPEFFDNLEGLIEATHHKLSYIFTSYRSLDQFSPSVFTRSSLAAFSKNIYFKPFKKKDSEIIMDQYLKLHRLNFNLSMKAKTLEIVDGYHQYLQLALIYLQEHKVKDSSVLFNELSQDERVNLQSEELWESLTADEQSALFKVSKKELLNDRDKEAGKYLFDTGILIGSKDEMAIFSDLFLQFIKQKANKISSENPSVEFSKKENLLFKFLHSNIDQVCEREAIIEAVWPEEDSLGISDWAIDRLVARLRNKLKTQNSPFEIVTIKTRGYKLANLK